MADFKEIKKKAAEVRKQLAALDKITGEGREREREYDRVRKSEGRKSGSVVIIPKCADWERRTLLEEDDEEWLLFYFGIDCGLDDPFWYKFTSQQKEMTRAIGHAMKYSDDQALAASRGEGKTTIAERLLLKFTLAGAINFSVLFAASGTMAENSLDAIKTAVTDNPLLLADYPEVCLPVMELHGAPQRANSMVVTGHRHDNGQPYEMAECRFTWCGQEIYFPKVPGSPSAGAIIATRGLDAAVRGLKIRGKRPKIAIIDDPDTEDTARSEEQAKKLERRIDSAIGGSGGQQRGIGRVFLTTLQSRIAVSFKFTDPQQKPTFKGKRSRFLIARPDRMDLWHEYVMMVKDDLQRVDSDGTNTDPFARRAHQFYIDNRETMDAGAEVSNPNRFNSSLCPDGSQREVSSLQKYFNEVAKLGPVAVATEYDNDPPEESGLIESGITAERIKRQINGCPRRIIPHGFTKLTRGIDVGKRQLYWVVRAWKPDGTVTTIDWGIESTYGTITGSDEGMDEAIKRALSEIKAKHEETPFCLADGEVIPISMTLVDSRYRCDAIQDWCMSSGLNFRPSMGHGKSRGCATLSFRMPLQKTRNIRAVGDEWFIERQPKGVARVNFAADSWKGWEHDRWMSDPAKIGGMTLFGEPPTPEQIQKNPTAFSVDMKANDEYARHLVSEIEVEQLNNKGALVRAWKHFPERGENHWFDASILCDVAASTLDIPLANRRQKPQPQMPDGGGWFAQQKKRA